MRTALLTLLTVLMLSSSASMAQPHSPQPTGDNVLHYDWVNG
jgi:hypothetical protein